MQAFSFSFKHRFQQFFCPYDPQTQKMKFLFGRIMAGGFAGICAASLIFPLDFARTKLAADVLIGSYRGKVCNRQYSGVFDVISKIYQTEGITGLYKGYSLSPASIFIYRGAWFGLYDLDRKSVV